jgi:hypothetical protein
MSGDITGPSLTEQLATLKTGAEAAMVTLEEARADLAELQATFDLVWKAHMRAIKRWQDATGKELVWPDQADLCVWLLEKVEAMETERGQLRERVTAMAAENQRLRHSQDQK